MKQQLIRSEIVQGSEKHNEAGIIAPPYPGMSSNSADFGKSAAGSLGRTRFMGAIFVTLGLLSLWYNWHTLIADGEFSIKMTIFGPFAVLGGLLMAKRPGWAGPIKPDSAPGQKRAMLLLFVVAGVASALNFYFLWNHLR